MEYIDRNCLSYWFPKLIEARLPVPKTFIARRHADCCLEQILDGIEPIGWKAFLDQLASSVKAMGTPCFLRTGQTSGKHQWAETCYLKSVDDLESHVIKLVEFSAMADFMGLSTNVWCVRELLPTRPICTLPDYGGMPLVKEFRAFVEAGVVRCVHDYWPSGAIEQGFRRHHVDPVELKAILKAADQSKAMGHPQNAPAYMMARDVAHAFRNDGAWSVDVLSTERGYFVTDMAEAHRSFHWQGCPNEH